MAGAPIYIDYTNWRGDRRVRRIVPRSFWYGESPWHTGRQWFMTALDPEEGDIRDFALRNIHDWDCDPMTTVDEEEPLPIWVCLGVMVTLSAAGWWLAWLLIKATIH